MTTNSTENGQMYVAEHPTSFECLIWTPPSVHRAVNARTVTRAIPQKNDASRWMLAGNEGATEWHKCFTSVFLPKKAGLYQTEFWYDETEEVVDASGFRRLKFVYVTDAAGNRVRDQYGDEIRKKRVSRYVWEVKPKSARSKELVCQVLPFKDALARFGVTPTVVSANPFG